MTDDLPTDTAILSRRRLGRAGTAALSITFTVAALASWTYWRYTAPVEVRLLSEVVGVPLDVRPEPAVISAEPNRMQRVVFHVHNPGPDVRRLSGRIELAPADAETQVSIFAMQCGDYTEIEPGATDTFAVVFNVKAAGLTGTRAITLRHVFAPATAGR
ncbi:MAG: hypothetical protein IT332_10800 [Ardenticatenales bacterium]|nr:hypothetical protein [Ardenticatenales bacterium]